MKTVYCKKWSVFRKQPHDIITEQEAKLRHEKDEAYTAVIYNSNHETVRYVVDVNSRFIVVNFFNEELENYLMYGFKKTEGKLFLNTAYYYRFQDNKEIEHIYFNFKENGDMVAEKKDYIKNIVEESEYKVDVSCNWECIPKFGEYQELLKEERKCMKC
ncbi:MAG: hypothetical protein ILP22_01310 [Oscillospiraceae bacterium]|nr:hypothetical protein [Oscillospiraceae bacterium]